MYRILEVLLEAQSHARQKLDKDLAASLKVLTGSSKAAKLAAKILKLAEMQVARPDTLKRLAAMARTQLLRDGSIAGRVE